MALNIVTADFTNKSRDVRVSPKLFQWDYGQILHIIGLDLPTVFEIHFSNERVIGNAIAHIAEGEYIEIPSEFLETGLTVYAFIFLHETDSDGETRYTITIPVNKRPKPIRTEPTPEEKSIIDEAIVALNNAITRTEESATAASQSEQNAKESETNAETYADRAEQAAETAQGKAEQAQQAAEKAAQESIDYKPTLTNDILVF